MSDSPEHAGAAYERAERLGYKVEPSPGGKGYCLWRIWPGSGRQMVVGQQGGATLDVINLKLTEIEKEERVKKDGAPNT
jgi:hypothetical protein